MKKMLVVLAALALLAMTSLATAVPSLPGPLEANQVTVTINVQGFAEVLVTAPALVGDGTLPEELLNHLSGGSTHGSGWDGGNFTVRCNTLSTLTITPDYFSNSGNYPKAVSGVGTDGIGYGLSCTLGALNVGLDGTQNPKGILKVGPIPAGVSLGHLTGWFYSDSFAQDVPGVLLAPVGTYTSHLTLTIAVI